MIITEYLNEKNLEEVLKFLYPNSNWIKNKMIPNDIFERRSNKFENPIQKRMFKPDYRSEEDSIIVEFDGIAHYQNSSVFWNDLDKKDYYEGLGYKFIQIPYFIQPTKEVVKVYFDIEVEKDLTDKKNGFNIENGKLNKNMPSSFSEDGVRRFISEFNSLDIVSQGEVRDTLNQNRVLSGIWMRVLPLSLIEFFEITLEEEEEKYNEHFQLKKYRM